MVPLALYLGMAMMLGLDSPGLQYDEALFQHGAVHLLSSNGDPPFAHYPHSWIRILGRNLPLMVMPYAGAAKFYILLIPFEVFGTSVTVARLVALILGCIGIFGISWFLWRHVDPIVALVTGMLIAVHPNYIAWTVYDSSGIAMWMASLGIVAIALEYHIRIHHGLSAFVLGVSLGFAVWSRANFVWLLAAVCVSLFLLYGRVLIREIRSVLFFVMGGLAGSLPLVLYELKSDFYTMKFMKEMQQPHTALDLLPSRFMMLVEAFLYDDHRSIIMWGGPERPTWDNWIVAGIVLLGLTGALVIPARNEPLRRSARLLSMVVILTLAITFTSRMGVNPYHLVGYVPIAISAVVTVAVALGRTRRSGAFILGAIAVFYVALTLRVNVEAARGLERSGGVGIWSDGIESVAATIRSEYADKELQILDWGYANNLYVLTSGRTRFREVYWGATLERSPSGRTWSEEIDAGGLFLMSSQRNTQVPLPRQGFLQALQQSGVRYRLYRFRQRGGPMYAELYVVE